MQEADFKAELKKFWKEHNLPGCPEFEFDNNLQMVIYTGMAIKDDNELISSEDE